MFAQSFEMARVERYAFDAQAASSTATPPLPPSPVPTTPTVPVAAPAAATQSSSRFFAAGVNGEATTSPHPTGWFTYATPISAMQGLYSYTTLQFNRGTGNTIQTTTATGLALFIRAIGPIDIYGNATAGVGTNGAVTAGAFSGGVVGIIHFKAGSPFVGVIGYNIIKSTISTASTLQAGIGYVPQ